MISARSPFMAARIVLNPEVQVHQKQINLLFGVAGGATSAAPDRCGGRSERGFRVSWSASLDQRLAAADLQELRSFAAQPRPGSRPQRTGQRLARQQSAGLVAKQLQLDVFYAWHWRSMNALDNALKSNSMLPEGFHPQQKGVLCHLFYANADQFQDQRSKGQALYYAGTTLQAFH